MEMLEVRQPAPRDDAWIPSACGICDNQSGIRAHRVDGTLVKIEGNPCVVKAGVYVSTVGALGPAL